ncbi:MAG: uroporphyrinogen-III synthase [Actinomycetes bacterium]
MPDVLLVRALGGDDKDAGTLRERGLTVVEDPFLVVRACADPGAGERAERVLAAISDTADWLVVTSQAALRALIDLTSETSLRSSIAGGRDRGLQFATVGEVTSAAMTDLGATPVLVPSVSTAEALRQDLATWGPATIIAPQGSQAMKGLAGGLRSLGWQVDEVVVYETSTVGARPEAADRLAAGDFAVVVLRSPTAVRAVASFVPRLPDGTTVVCGGPTTAAEVERTGLGTVVISPGPTADAVADAVQACLADGITKERP